MRKIRSFLAVIALVATLGGFSLQGMGALANATANSHASAQHVITALHIKPNGPCIGGGVYDC